MSQANGSSPVISHSLQGYDPHLFIKRPVFQQLRRNIFHFQKHIKVDEYKSRKKLMVKQFHSILKSDLSFGKTWRKLICNFKSCSSTGNWSCFCFRRTWNKKNITVNGITISKRFIEMLPPFKNEFTKAQINQIK